MCVSNSSIFCISYSLFSCHMVFYPYFDTLVRSTIKKLAKNCISSKITCKIIEEEIHWKIKKNHTRYKLKISSTYNKIYIFCFQGN